jgi:hypothetical protein
MIHARLEGQKIVPELAVETEGLYNLIYDIADRYGARSNGLQGQSSIGARYELAQRAAQRWIDERVRTLVLSVADYDKQGDEILAAVAADAAQHLRDMGLPVDRERILQFQRVALTERQINEHNIPTVPVETEDGQTRLVQQAEALPTDVLRAEVEAALRATLNMKLFDRIAREKQREINAFVGKVREFCESMSFDDE